MNIYPSSRRLAICLLLSVLGLTSARAAIFTWGVTAAGTSEWSNSGNWTGLAAPVSGNTTELDFTSAGAASYTADNDLGSSFNLNKLVLSNTAVLSTVQGGSLVFANNGGTSPSIQQNNTGSFAVNNAISIAGVNLSVTGGTTGQLTFGGAISGAGGSIAISLPGTTVLSGANTYDSGTTLSAGTLDINNASAVGTGTLTLAGGVFGNTSAGAITLSTNNAISLTGGVNFTSSQDLNLGTGAVTVSGNPYIAVNNRTLTFGGAFSTTSALTKYSNGTLALTGGSSGAHSSMGTYYAIGGVTNVSGYLDTTGLHVASGGTINWSGTGTETGDFLAAGDFSSGTVNITGNLSSAPASSMFIGYNSTGAVNVSGGSLAITSNAPIYIAGGYDGTGTGTGTLTVANGGVFTTGTTTGLIVVGSHTSASGTGTVELDGGTFSTLRSITTGAGSGAAAVVNFNGGTLQATGNNTNLLTVTTANVRNGGVVIDTGTYSVTINQALVHSTIAGDAAIDGGLTKLSAGTLTLAGANTYTGNTTLNAGQLYINNASAIGTGTFTMAGGSFGNNSGGAITLSTNNPIVANASMTFNGTQNLNLGTGAATYNGGYIVLNNAGVALTFGGTFTSGNLVQYAFGTLAFTGGSSGTHSSIGAFANSGGVTNFSGYLDSQGLRTAGGILNWSGTGTETGAFLGIGDGGAGTLNVTAGSLTVAPSTGFTTFIGNGANGAVNVSGGTLAIASNTPIYLAGGFAANASGTGTLTISNSGVFTTGTTTGVFTLGSYTSTTGTGTVELDGGTFSTARSITTGAGGGAVAVVNFNGGTLQATGTNSNLLTITAANVRNGGAVIDTQGFPVTINQALVHSTIAGDAATDGGLTKKGSGTLTLSGVNSYNGATSVKAGTLIVNGSLLGSSPVTVGDSSNPSTRAILAGEGTVGAVTVGSGANDTGATLNPGNGAGTITGTTLTTGGLTLNSGAHISLQLGRTAAGSSTGGNVSDQIVVNGGISLAGDLQISLLASTGYSIAPGDILYLIINQSGSPVTGTFGSLNGVVTNLSNDQVFSFNGESFEITYHAQSGLGAFTGGNDVALMVVPEPSIFATLLVSGGLLICLKGLGRRRARA